MARWAKITEEVPETFTEKKINFSLEKSGGKINIRRDKDFVGEAASMDEARKKIKIYCYGHAG